MDNNVLVFINEFVYIHINEYKLFDLDEHLDFDFKFNFKFDFFDHNSRLNLTAGFLASLIHNGHSI